MNRGRMVMVVVPRGESDSIMAAIRNRGATGGTVIYGRGTASSSLLSILGFSDTKREILISFVEEAILDGCREEIEKRGKKGILAIRGDEEMNEDRWTMIEIICEAGYADDCMAEARKVGAKGGTIIKGHGTAKDDDVKFFGYPITSEKEVLVIVEKTEVAKAIMEKVESLPYISKKGKAAVFGIPVSYFRNFD